MYYVMSSSVTLDKKEITNFLTALYPLGDYVNSMVDRVEKVYSIERDAAQQYTLEILKQLENKQLILMMNKKNPKNGIIESHVSLTDKGKGIVWNNIQKLFKTDPKLAFKKIKKWKDLGDEESKRQYYKILTHELKSHAFDLYSLLIIPHTKEEILHNMLLYYNVDPTDKKNVNKVVKVMMDLINRGMAIGLIVHDSQTYVSTDENGNTQQKTEDIFELSSDGVEGLRYINNAYLNSGNSQPIKAKKKEKEQVLHNLWDLPLKRIYVWVAIAFGLAYFFGYAYPEFQSNALANGMLTYTKSMGTFVGIFLFLVSFSEIYGRIIEFVKKTPKEKRVVVIIAIISIIIIVIIGIVMLLRTYYVNYMLNTRS